MIIKNDDDNNSIENQLKQANIYKSQLPEYIDNFKIYNDGEGKSGTLDDTKRPELKKLTDDIEAGLITSV
ncbi:phage major tail tube protein [Lutibacter sp. A80]|uniref:phage major tail tube protein n=1 Tax=Lutibacter sp. A80 TaxID=2918453 RepID=UPI001F069BEC|nr:phage major tail tube protein [Lutibacter sp. A80]UMB61607.1 phage major tail tube protein [Lutibacter sp. A80]